MKRRCSACVLALAALAGTVGVRAQDPKCPEQKLASPDGPGVMVKGDCTREEGMFRNGRLWGQGKVTASDGTVYEGEFIEGQLWGQGKTTRAAPQKSWHEGQYYNGVPTGVGRRGDEYGVVYNGYFYQGAPYGIGIATFPHGGKLIGEFRPGLGGVGEFVAVLPDGSEHTGSYGPMYGKLSLFQPQEAPAAQSAGTPPAKTPEAAKTADPNKTKADIDKAIGVLRGLIKR